VRIFNTYFTDIQLIGIFLSLSIGLISVYLFLNGKAKTSILFLFLSGLLLRFVVINLDPFLWTWDEQFHALVAKNMTLNPFKPMLFASPVLDYDYQNWKENHIWLHKQPLFLWQIAISFKIFGINELALRVPSMIMMTLLVPIIYRIGKLAVNDSVGYFGAFLYSYSFYFIQFVSGYKFTDHNDSAFIFYIALSIWSWVEYVHEPEKRRWIILIGLFSGMAILNKWVVGLLVFSGWIATILFTISTVKTRFEESKKLILSFLICLIVAVPWQIYTLVQFPRESQFELRYNGSHFFSALEGHGETWFYHFKLLAEQYGGPWVYFLIIPGFILLLMKSQPKIRFSLLTMVFITYLFFSIAATKSPMFCAIVSPIIFLALGSVLHFILVKLRFIMDHKCVVFGNALILVIVGSYTLKINDLDCWHSNQSENWRILRTNAIIARHLTSRVSPDHVIFNCSSNNSVMLSFYTGMTSYERVPTYDQYKDLSSKQIKMAIFVKDGIPDYLMNDNSVQKIFLKQISY
jgi:4-amino-4-deoxy-L-arabinose transferase